MARVVVLGDVFGLVARRTELLELFDDTQALARREPGCLAYSFAEVVGEPGHFLIAQVWRDAAALETHYRSESFAVYQHRVGELLARPSDVEVHHVSETLHPEETGPMDPRRAD